MNEQHVMVLGIGNILFCDEGVGVRVIEEMQKRYCFPQNVSLVDGGVLGLNLLGVMSEADHLIVVDAVQNRGKPGDLYRLNSDEIPDRIRAKNSLHQIDFLESLTMCQVMDRVPETVVVGVEPEDFLSCTLEMTETIKGRIDDLIEMVLKELDRLNVPYEPIPEGTRTDVPRNTL